jgi:hypothetical protein
VWNPWESTYGDLFCSNNADKSSPATQKLMASRSSHPNAPPFLRAIIEENDEQKMTASITPCHRINPVDKKQFDIGIDEDEEEFHFSSPIVHFVVDFSEAEDFGATLFRNSGTSSKFELIGDDDASSTAMDYYEFMTVFSNVTFGQMSILTDNSDEQMDDEMFPFIVLRDDEHGPAQWESKDLAPFEEEEGKQGGQQQKEQEDLEEGGGEDKLLMALQDSMILSLLLGFLDAED